MFYTDAKDLHYRAGVPRDHKLFFAEIGGRPCPNCGAEAGFSTLNEYRGWDEVGHRNPCRCAVCQHQWHDD